MTIYFFPHHYLRDRQLDTIRNWPIDQVANPEIAQNRRGAQVSKAEATSNKNSRSWKQILPLINIKLRPKQAPKDAAIYVWGGLLANGRFIVDIDNPWSLVGYNVPAMSLYKLVIKYILLSQRCLEIRCMSEACRQSLKALFGETVYQKAIVHYPSLTQPNITQLKSELTSDNECCRFLFVGTQFEIKGGRSLLQACHDVAQAIPNSSFTIITHLPNSYRELAASIPHCFIMPANMIRDEVLEIMHQSDVLVHPSYIESFGMVLLEAIRCGLAVITTDMYASNEIVVNKQNGFVIKPPISAWDGCIPTNNFHAHVLLKNMQSVDYSQFTKKLTNAMIAIASDKNILDEMKRQSICHFNNIFGGRK